MWDATFCPCPADRSFEARRAPRFVSLSHRCMLSIVRAGKCTASSYGIKPGTKHARRTESLGTATLRLLLKRWVPKLQLHVSQHKDETSGMHTRSLPARSE